MKPTTSKLSLGQESRTIDIQETYDRLSSNTVEEDVSEIPEIGDTIRTKKMQMEGKVERVDTNRSGYEEVFFRIADGRLMKTPVENVVVIEKLSDADQYSTENQLDEVSSDLLARYKSAAGASAREADRRGDYATGNKRFSGIVKATKKQFANDLKKPTTKEGYTVVPGIDTNRYQERAGLEGPFRAKNGKVVYYDAKEGQYYDPDTDIYISHDEWEEMNEGSMGGINRSAPSNDVSYEEILDEVYSKWIAEQSLNELSVDTLMAYKKSAASPKAARTRPLRKMAKSVQGVQTAQGKIDAKTGRGKSAAPDRGTNEDCWDGYEQIGMKDKGGKKVPNCVPKTNEVYQGPWHGDPAKLAKAPKSTMQGKEHIKLSDLVQDSINVHGLKHSFEYYVKKHGMPPRHFQIYAGLVADPRKKEFQPPPTQKSPEPPKQKPAAEKPAGKESWWNKLRGKLPFEE